MITDIILFSAIVFAAAFLVGWMARPDLRAWIERPKYRFQANVQRYDHVQCGDPGSEEGKSA